MGYTIMEKMYSLRNELYDQPEWVFQFFFLELRNYNLWWKIFRSKTLADFAQLSFQNKRYDYVLFCLKLCQEFGKQDAIDLIRQEFEKSEINIQDENLR